MSYDCPEAMEPSMAELVAMDEYLDALVSGACPDLDAFLRRYPKFEKSLRPVLEAGRGLRRLSVQAHASQKDGREMAGE